MKTLAKILLISVLVICLFGIFLYSGSFDTLKETSGENTPLPDNSPVTSVPQQDLPRIVRNTGHFIINATLFRNASTVKVYRGEFEENGSIDLHFESMGDIRWNITSEEDAPEVAKRIMESYGGIPSDAEFNGASTHYSRRYNLSSNQYVSKEPMYTTVSYSQEKIDRMEIIGNANFIIVALGDYGEPLWIHKEWRTYFRTGEVALIPLDEAIEKLGREELVHSDWHPETGDISIDAISLAYYAEKDRKNDTFLEPVWMFSGVNATTRARLNFYVYAREFAGFTAIPSEKIYSRDFHGSSPVWLVSVTTSDEVLFRDESEASPSRWLWEFGDGTNSTHKHPSHSYTRPGNYTVTLTVWNNLGSDILVKKDYIRVMEE